MDKMQQFYIKTTATGIFGAVTSGGGWLASEYLHGALANLLLICFLISSLVAIASAIFLLAINIRRNRIKAIDEVRAEMLLCDECRSGKRPAKCPIPSSNRPENCPMTKLEEKIAKLARLKKIAENLLKEETTRR